MANKLSDVMDKMNLGNKRSFTQTFLDDMAQEETVSKKGLRKKANGSIRGPLRGVVQSLPSLFGSRGL